jgi:hypothetical protein
MSLVSVPELGQESKAALKTYRRLLVSDPGSMHEQALTEILEYQVERIPLGQMRAYACAVVETVKTVHRK